MFVCQYMMKTVKLKLLQYVDLNNATDCSSFYVMSKMILSILYEYIYWIKASNSFKKNSLRLFLQSEYTIESL